MLCSGIVNGGSSSQMEEGREEDLKGVLVQLKPPRSQCGRSHEGLSHSGSSE